MALSALAFLAGDMQRLGRFLALTGLGPAELRKEARSPRLLAAVLDHLSRDESLLLTFASTHDLDPQLVGKALHRLEAMEDPG